MEYIPSSTAARILCCQCGVAIAPNSANMCMPCIQSTVDITEGIPRQIAITSCRNCDRYFQPPVQWLKCEAESKELMALLLRRIKGLNKIRLIDAAFVWTEPHSKRLKVKLTIQKEAFASTILQQSFVVEAIVGNQQCGDCTKVQAKNTWNSAVQVRQKVNHKKTFLYLEQVILKHDAHREANNVKVVRDGIDFYFDHRTAALKFQDFLTSVVPVRSKSSEQLIAHDTHSGSSTYKFTFSVEIIPICRDDLVLVPPAVARSLGGIPPLVICQKVATSLHFVDPNTLQTLDMQSQSYWKTPFEALCTHKDLVEFIVLDVERDGRAQGKYALADVTVARAAEFGRSSETFCTRSHLANILKPGDICLGYDLLSTNFNHAEFEATRLRYDLPDIVLVRKSFAHLRRSRTRRPWRLRELPKDMDEDLLPTKAEQAVQAREYEQFLQDLEENPELRANVNLYRVPRPMDVTDAESEGEGAPQVSLEELLDDLTIHDD